MSRELLVSVRVEMPPGGTMGILGLLAFIAAIISSSLAQSDPRERQCTGGICVPFYLCSNGFVIEDGDGLIDKRFADSECPDDNVCCKVKEPECRGQCVPTNQCPSDGTKYQLDLRSFDDKCPGDLVCCNEPPAEPTPCTCVAFYQCLDDVVNTGGKDLIDLRFSDEKCPGDEVCCVNIRPQDNTIVVESSCKGKCVPFALCPNRTSSSGGVDLRAFDDCPNDQVCCESLPDTSVEVPKVCDGKCVPFYQCPGGVPNTAGQHLINLRSSESVCPADQICCSTAESLPKPVIPKPVATESSSCNGTCVPFYQCPQGQPNTGGLGLLNLRSFDDCPNDLVCCEASSTEVSTKPPIVCEGKCVPVYQCPLRSSSSDGQNQLDLRSHDDSCPGDQVCCKESVQNPKSSCKGKCVPFNQCPQGQPNTGGLGLLNIRSFEDCPNDLVCCEATSTAVSTKPPVVCEGKCVPVYQCPLRSSSSDGQNQLDLRSHDDSCPGDQVCCKESVQNPKSSCKGQCVPFYQCPQGQPNTGGLGLLNLRSIDNCPNDLVCCEASSTEVSTKPPIVCEGKCVPVYQCPLRSSSSDGQNQLDLRSHDDSCPGDQVCCKESVQNPKSSCKGKCVPFNQCPQGQPNTGGLGLLNIRSFEDCPNDLVCCEATSTAVSTKPPVVCVGKCVPVYQCPVRSSNTNSQNQLDLRSYDNSCPGDQVCCKESVQTPKSSCKGQCVPFYQCPQGQPNTGGLGLLNLRSIDNCPNDLVCCEASSTEVSTKPPIVCEGKCVPVYQCPLRSSSSDGQNQLDLRSHDDSCPGDQVCCKESVQNPKSSCKGKCVPFNQCPQGQPNTGGLGLLNIRSFEDCPNDLVCCEATSTAVSTKPPVVCVGKCVPVYQCPVRSSNTNSQNQLDLRSYDNSCPGDQVCCKESVQTPKSSCKGKCVPFNQCPQGQPNTRGLGLLNIRSFNDCPNNLVCCESDPVAPKICQGQCVQSFLCMSATHGVEDLLNLRTSNDLCPKDLVCCENTEIIHLNPHQATWMQWINDINGMQVVGGQPVKYHKCSLRIDLNGPFAEQREVPWLVTIWSKVQYLSQTREDYHCVGTVIRSDVVLVPADCVANIPASQLYVRAGNYNLKATDGVTELKIKNINIHPDVDFTNGHANVALLSLQSTAASPSTACLARHDEHLSEQNCFLVGWTSLDLLGNGAALPRKHRLNLKGTPSCRSDSLCIAGNTESAHHCDSFYGSPLICPDMSGQQWRVAGLVTRGSARCGANAIPEIMIKVSSLQPWISEQLAPSFVNKPAGPEPSRKYLPGF